MIDNKLHAYAYRLCTELYLELFKNLSIKKYDHRFITFGESVQINTVTNVGHLPKNLFQELPSCYSSNNRRNFQQTF